MIGERTVSESARVGREEVVAVRARELACYS
jgi:hypothetical protein